MYTYAKYICTNRFCYGFNIGQKLETSPHENQNTPVIDDFLNFRYNSNFKLLFGRNIWDFYYFDWVNVKRIYYLKLMLIWGFYLEPKFQGLSSIVKGFPT